MLPHLAHSAIYTFSHYNQGQSIQKRVGHFEILEWEAVALVVHHFSPQSSKSHYNLPGTAKEVLTDYEGDEVASMSLVSVAHRNSHKYPLVSTVGPRKGGPVHQCGEGSRCLYQWLHLSFPKQCQTSPSSFARHRQHRLKTQLGLYWFHLLNSQFCFYEKQNCGSFTSHHFGKKFNCLAVPMPLIVPPYNDHCDWQDCAAASTVWTVGCVSLATTLCRLAFTLSPWTSSRTTWVDCLFFPTRLVPSEVSSEVLVFCFGLEIFFHVSLLLVHVGLQWGTCLCLYFPP